MRRHSISGSVTRMRAGCEDDLVSLSDNAEEPNMIVAVRIRPLSSAEKEKGHKSCCSVLNGKIVAIKKEGDPSGYLRSQLSSINDYGFDSAFDEHSTQSQVYEGTAKRFIPNVIKGLNVTVFAYGATGAGKTHTMLGNTRADESAAAAEAGIIPQAVFDLFQQLEAKKGSQECSDNKHSYSVVVSFVEIYNEQVYDLLDMGKSGKVLQLREDPERGVVHCAGCTETVTSSAKEVMSLLAVGNKNRKTEATMANAVSSRSHAVLQLQLRHLERNETGRETLTESKLSLIDLAGSERASATNNRGARLTEGANINKSLLALANCINALATNSGGGRKTNVKYRDSRLTHLLKSSLEGGNCNLVMIANVNPADVTFEDSHNTLKYANRAKQIKVNPAAQAVAVESTWLERETHLRQENQLLRARVAELEVLVQQLQSGRATGSEGKAHAAAGAFSDGCTGASLDALRANANAQTLVDNCASGSASASSRRSAAATSSLGYILEETDSFLLAAEDEEQEEYEEEEYEEEEMGKNVKSSRKLSWHQQHEQELEKEQQAFSEAWGLSVDETMDTDASCSHDVDLVLHDSQMDEALQSCSVIEAEMDTDSPSVCDLDQSDMQAKEDGDGGCAAGACEDETCDENDVSLVAEIMETEVPASASKGNSAASTAAADDDDDFVQTMNEVAVACVTSVSGPAAAAAALKISSGAAVLTATALNYSAKSAVGTAAACQSPARATTQMRSATSGSVAANPFFAVLSSARKPAAAIARMDDSVESDPKSVDSSISTAAVFAAAAESAYAAVPVTSTAVGLFSKRGRAPAVTAEVDAVEKEMDTIPRQDIQNKRRRTLSSTSAPKSLAAAKVAAAVASVAPITAAAVSNASAGAMEMSTAGMAVEASVALAATASAGVDVDEIVNLPVSIKHPPAAAPAKRVLRRTSIGNSSSTAAVATAKPSKEGDKDKENSHPQILNQMASVDPTCKDTEKDKGKGKGADQDQDKPEDQERDQDSKTQPLFKPPKSSIVGRRKSLEGSLAAVNAMLEALSSNTTIVGSKRKTAQAASAAASASGSQKASLSSEAVEDGNVTHVSESQQQSRQAGSARGLQARPSGTASSSASSKQARNPIAVVPANTAAAAAVRELEVIGS